MFMTQKKVRQKHWLECKEGKQLPNSAGGRGTEQPLWKAICQDLRSWKLSYILARLPTPRYTVERAQGVIGEGVAQRVTAAKYLTVNPQMPINRMTNKWV